MAAFNQLVLGTIQEVSTSSSVMTSTTIMNTVLAQTEELAFIHNWDPRVDVGIGFPSLQTVFSSSAGWAYPGLVNMKLPHSRGDLRSTLEELFQSFTTSLLAEPYLQ